MNVSKLSLSFVIPLGLSFVVWAFYLDWNFNFEKLLHEKRHRQTTAMLYPYTGYNTENFEDMGNYDDMALRLCTTDKGKFCQPTAWQSDGSCRMSGGDFESYMTARTDFFNDTFKNGDIYTTLTTRSIGDVFVNNNNLAGITRKMCELTRVPNKWFTGGNHLKDTHNTDSGVYILVHEHVGLVVSYLFVSFFSYSLLDEFAEKYESSKMINLVANAVCWVVTVAALFTSTLITNRWQKYSAIEQPVCTYSFVFGWFALTVSFGMQFWLRGLYKNKFIDFYKKPSNRVANDTEIGLQNQELTVMMSEQNPPQIKVLVKDKADGVDSFVFLAMYVFWFALYAIACLGGWIPITTVFSFAFWLVLACLLPNFLLNVQCDIEKNITDEKGIRYVFFSLCVVFILIIYGFAFYSVMTMSNYYFQHDLNLVLNIFGYGILILSLIQYGLCVKNLKETSSGKFFLCDYGEFVVVYIVPIVFLVAFLIVTWTPAGGDIWNAKLNYFVHGTSVFSKELSAYTRHFEYNPST